MKNSNFFKEFEQPEKGSWRKLAEEQLKGVPFEKKLVAQTPDGIHIQPIYTAGDICQSEKHFPGIAPFIRGYQAAGSSQKGWLKSQNLKVAKPASFNELARESLKKGQSALNITINPYSCLDEIKTDNLTGRELTFQHQLLLGNMQECKTGFAGIDSGRIPMHIQAGSSALPIYNLMVSTLEAESDSPKLQGSLEADPLSELLSSGTLPRTLKSLYDEMAQITKDAIKNRPKLRTIGVSTEHLCDNGSSITLEIATALATGTEYIRQMQNRGLTLNDCSRQLIFRLGISAHYFMEIAKFRAFRSLWAQVIEAFGGCSEEQKSLIHASCNQWNKTVLDPYVNMLRATTEAFSAVVGGVDSLHVAAFDETLTSPDSFSQRIARNTQLILQEEAKLGRVIDPAGGSSYVESLTKEIREKSWKLFQQIEREGGITKTIESGWIQQKTAECVTFRLKQIRTRKSAIVGTSTYANLTEKMLTSREICRQQTDKIIQNRNSEVNSFKSSRDNKAVERELQKLAQQGKDNCKLSLFQQAIQKGATLEEISSYLNKDEIPINVTPLKNTRAAAEYELLRENAEHFREKNSRRPQAFLANMGQLKQYKARSEFSSGFLQPGGFEILADQAFTTPEEAAQGALESEAEVTVICSTDDTYPDFVPEICKLIKENRPQMQILLAGYPKEHINSFQAAGVDDFIHLKADNLTVLTKLQEKTGVSK